MYEPTTFSIGDVAEFYRTLGSPDQKQRRKQRQNYNIGRAVFNPDVANAAAVGGTLGGVAEAVTKGEPSVKAKATKGILGAIRRHRKLSMLGGGVALGAGLGIGSKLKKQRNLR